MVHLAVDFGQHVAVAAHQAGLDLQAERQVAAVARLGDLAQPVDRLRQVLLRIAPPRRIEGKAAEQLRLEGMGQLARLLHVAGQVLLDRHVGVLACRPRRRNSLTLPMGEPSDDTFSPYSF